MATLGIKVTLVEARKEVLGFLDHERRSVPLRN
jgi:hypothetical protein